MNTNFTPVNSDAHRLQQLAGYLAHGIDAKQAGAAVGFSASRVSQLMQTEDFQAMVAEKSHEILTRYVDTNKMYDEIENQALKNVALALKYNSDPDLNMRAAMLANRAVRKGQFGYSQTPLAPQNNGQRLNIALTFNMINKVQNGELSTSKVIDVENGSAEVNYATPQIVEQILHAAAANTVDTPHDQLLKKKGLAGLLEPLD